MNLRKARVTFTRCICELVLWAATQGYEAAFAEGMDRPTAKDPTTDHMKGSLHEIGLAQDIDLYRGDVYLTETEDHIPLSEQWKQIGVKYGVPLAWGGDFKDKDGNLKPDGNHYSLEFNGKK